ncbi:helix-turn-helix domain-containing protein [Streptomyces sp. NA04227]|uniref:helix-turn-helix domain-containing protein n=1 Tax=Streptomyces sp. NA04227 TaxID=2742136 RepID=UPI0015921854|nr:XRE family transcriptional regulator [Streptomyces sp. NA04227]QKW07135.1 helix-turn-helix domain-containing protein [Streptomyces sp. NA04227]
MTSLGGNGHGTEAGTEAEAGDGGKVGAGVGPEVPAACRVLAAALREVRERTGLSLTALAGRTPYSRSSWERFLNAKSLPPLDAVRALCELAGDPPATMTARWELAEAAWRGRARTGAGTVREAPGTPAAAASRETSARTEPEVHPSSPSSTNKPSVPPTGKTSASASASPTGRAYAPISPTAKAPASASRARRAWVAAAACVAALAVLASVVALVTVVRRDGDAGTAAPSPQYAPGCTGRSCEGKDPKKMGCGGYGMTTTPLRRTLPGGRRIEVRHGTACGAVWARAMGLRLGDEVRVTVPGSTPKLFRAKTPADTRDYRATPMTPARTTKGVRLCLLPGDSQPAQCFTA